jgi:hypothetical protein
MLHIAASYGRLAPSICGTGFAPPEIFSANVQNLLVEQCSTCYSFLHARRTETAMFFWWLKKRKLRRQMRRLAHRILQEEAELEVLGVDRWLALEEQDAVAFDQFTNLILQSTTAKRDLLLRRKELALQLERL